MHQARDTADRSIINTAQQIMVPAYAWIAGMSYIPTQRRKFNISPLSPPREE